MKSDKRFGYYRTPPSGITYMKRTNGTKHRTHSSGEETDESQVRGELCTLCQRPDSILLTYACACKHQLCVACLGNLSCAPIETSCQSCQRASRENDVDHVNKTITSTERSKSVSSTSDISSSSSNMTSTSMTSRTKGRLPRYRFSTLRPCDDTKGARNPQGTKVDTGDDENDQKDVKIPTAFDEENDENEGKMPTAFYEEKNGEEERIPTAFDEEHNNQRKSKGRSELQTSGECNLTTVVPAPTESDSMSHSSYADTSHHDYANVPPLSSAPSDGEDFEDLIPDYVNESVWMNDYENSDFTNTPPPVIPRRRQRDNPVEAPMDRQVPPARFSAEPISTAGRPVHGLGRSATFTGTEEISLPSVRQRKNKSCVVM